MFADPGSYSTRSERSVGIDYHDCPTACYQELLSKQDHYDWGLRAIKSVLVVAGSLKRADQDRPEEQVGANLNIYRVVHRNFCRF